MSDLEAFLAGIVADPHNTLRWLVMADYLEENGQPERAELVRVHRELLRTCTEPDAFPERPALHARMMELMRGGVLPCIPQKTLVLPGGAELKMSFIPPGDFLMGSPESEAKREDDETLHRVTLTKGFWLGQSPVTQAQWRAVMGTDPSHFNGDELPVEQVSWDDARNFCELTAARTETAVDLRLPTEAEWEYAARAGTTTPYYWGTDLNGAEANCYGIEPYGTAVVGPFLNRTTSVGRYALDSPHSWALSDVIGNVGEWCEDYWDQTDYQPAPTVDPTGPTAQSERALRGGGWLLPAHICRIACRGGFPQSVPDEHHGFRIAADLE